MASSTNQSVVVEIFDIEGLKLQKWLKWWHRLVPSSLGELKKHWTWCWSEGHYLCWLNLKLASSRKVRLTLVEERFRGNFGVTRLKVNSWRTEDHRPVYLTRVHEARLPPPLYFDPSGVDLSLLLVSTWQAPSWITPFTLKVIICGKLYI